MARPSEILNLAWDSMRFWKLPFSFVHTSAGKRRFQKLSTLESVFEKFAFAVTVLWCLRKCLKFEGLMSLPRKFVHGIMVATESIQLLVWKYGQHKIFNLPWRFKLRQVNPRSSKYNHALRNRMTNNYLRILLSLLERMTLQLSCCQFWFSDFKYWEKSKTETLSVQVL